MSTISKKFENLVISYNKKLVDAGTLIPVKMKKGIMIGDTLIISNNNLKTVIGRNVEYKDIFLNLSAIKIANLLALRKDMTFVEKIYQLDQEYGKYFTKSQYLLSIHAKYSKIKNYEKADTIWAKYQEIRDRAELARTNVERFLNYDK